ncbi:MAG: hypothetical protein DRH44_07000 [Candidatus Coatesbacteria bacterium]|nr:MAG: hypothetical protein DRH44_07000 [Candidatus Coatesbacteria bacterium]
MKLFLKICGIIAFSLAVIWLLFLFMIFSGRVAPTGLYSHLKAITIVISLVSLLLAVFGTICGFIYFRRERSKLAIIGSISGILCVLFLVALLIAFFQVKSYIIEYAQNPERLSEIELNRSRCMQNQEQLELIANEFWRSDHPDASEDEILNINCGPGGDLVGIRKGRQFIYYITDMSVFDCPADEDPNDIDYQVSEVDENGFIHIICIDPKGKLEGHNRR